MAGAPRPIQAAVSRHDDGHAAGDRGLDALRQITPRRLIDAGEWLIEQ